MTRARWAVAVAVPAAAVALGAALASGGGSHRAAAAQEPGVATAPVTRGALNAIVTLTGILGHRAAPDVVNRASGTYTSLPATGASVGCGDVLYRVDDRPVLLLCGAVPAYRALRIGDHGRDVRQLNRALRVHDGAAFTWRTQRALERVQKTNHMHITGTLPLGAAVFLPGPVRIARADAAPGAPARPGAPVLRTTARALTVQADLDASQQGIVHVGDRVRVTLPGNASARGRVERLGAVVQSGKGPAATATIPAGIALDDPRRARGLDQAPVQVDITTRGVDDVLSVPVTALAGASGGGYAVEVVRPGGARAQVRVRLGLFDTAAGRVEVGGALRAGDRVVVPAA
jgi:multidrug efflux pump subunit AcrA (membrane-fusion protein)